MKIRLLYAALLSMAFTAASAQIQVKTERLTYTVSNGSVVSIHDPSVVYRNGTYTVWGSHLGCATSTDLVSWTGVNGNNFRKLASQGATTGTACGYSDAFNVQQVSKIKNYKGEELDFPNFDAEAYCSRYAADKSTWVNGDMWAPDIIYNKEMKKWCMYLSLNGDNWSSIIILLTSATSTGPFTYQGPVVMGGFNGQTYNGVDAPKIAETDYEIATGEKTFAARYKQAHNGTYWPNCIDPCVFYDEEGELWMTYGSWSGGIFMLKLDKTTGLRDYTYTYPSDYASAGASGVSDPYYGKKIAGGYYVSGEGSYIQHIGNYYYLFMSYGGFAPDGGYDMRLFRSEKPDGPYVDASGKSALFTSYLLNYGKNANDTRGMKLMSAYNNWGEMQEVGETAQGHNSACVDGEGGAYVVYHTKFNDGTAGHQVRVRKLFTNKNGWLVASPFTHTGQSQTYEENFLTAYWAKKQIAGEYRLLLHPFKQDHTNMQEATPIRVTLTEDGKVTGDMTGTWSRDEGTNLMTIKLGSATYNGVFCYNTVNGATKQGYKIAYLTTIGFTAVCDTKGNASAGVPVWGYKLDDISALAYNYQNNTIGVKAGQVVSSNLKLMFPTEHNTTIQWTSSEPSVISETGKYDPTGLNENLPVTLTARMECGSLFWEQAYNVKAKAESYPTGDYKSGLVAYYDFNEKPTYNHYKADGVDSYDAIYYGKWGSGTAPSFETDYERDGKFVHLYFGANASNSYARMPNPLAGQTKADGSPLDGFTISVWVKRTDVNVWDALWGFFNTTNATSTSSARLFMTGNSYLGYNDAADNYFDLNHPNTKELSNIPVGEWTLLTLTVGPENGIRMYINGTNKAFSNIASSYEVSGTTIASKIKTLPLADIISKVTSLKYFYLGNGSFWGSADACYDDLMIYNRELSATDVKAVNTMCNRVYHFGPADETGIEDVFADEPSSIGSLLMQNVTYDLSGRRVSPSSLKKGIYVVNGKKVLK